MTFRDLRKRLALENMYQSQFDRFKNKPFWIWDIDEHKQEDIKTNGDCCFNHIIGLPRKEETEKPIFDYQKLLYDSLLNPDYYNTFESIFQKQTSMGEESDWIGVTEFFP